MSCGLSDARRILILAPHPDDEIVACGTAAMRAVATGAQVFVLYLTTGVPPAADLWPWRRKEHTARVARRRAEAEASAALIGLKPIRFLGWPSRRLLSFRHRPLIFMVLRAAIRMDRLMLQIPGRVSMSVSMAVTHGWAARIS